MIHAKIGHDGVTIADETIAKKWDNFGAEMGAVPAVDLNSVRPYKAISVLTSCGEVEIGVFDTRNTTMKGSLDSVSKLSMSGGFRRMLPLRGKHEGVAYTQTIFIYDADFDLSGALSCIKR